jgi:hypothetical protein
MPGFPEGLEYLWDHFLKLARRRQIGMAAGPLTYLELEAYERKALVRLSAWETALIMRIDDAVLTVWAGNRKPKPTGDAEPVAIPTSDVTGMRSLFRGLATFKKQQLKEVGSLRSRA